MKKRICTVVIGVLMLAGKSLADKPERPSGHEQVPGWATNALQRLEYGVLLEVEGFASKTGGENQSDIVVATVAFDVEAAMNDWLMGHIGLLWEQYSRETDNVDEAYIALGASETIPFYLVAGRFYQPVGNFESAFISDPLTLELIEMNQVAGMVGYGIDWIDITAGAFNGDTKAGYVIDGSGETNSISDTTISDFFASATLTPVEQLKIGAYWLSDMMETYKYGQIGDLISDQPGYEKVGGAGVFANAYLGLVTVNAEFASALNDYDLAGGVYRPAAFNLEGSVQVHDQVSVGLKYEASDDLYAAYDRAILQFGEKFPGQAYGAVVAYQFHEYATVAAEYLHVDELDNDARGDIVTVQFGLEF